MTRPPCRIMSMLISMTLERKEGMNSFMTSKAIYDVEGDEQSVVVRRNDDVEPLFMGLSHPATVTG